MEQNQLSKLVGLALSFPEFVREYAVFKNWEVPDVHLEIADYLQNSGHDAAGVCAARNIAKSTIVQLYCCWRWLLEPRLRILVVSQNNKLSKSFSKQCQTILRTFWPVQHLYNKGRSDTFYNIKYCGEEQFESMACFTVLGSFTGRRADLIVLDDPMASSRSYSEAECTHALHGMMETQNLLQPAGRFFLQNKLQTPTYARTRTVVLYTPHNFQPHDYYIPHASHADHFMRSVATKHWPAVKDAKYNDEGQLIDGSSVFEFNLPFERLKSESKTNPRNFKLQRMVDSVPIQDDHALVKIDKIIRLNIDWESDVSMYNSTEPVAFLDPSNGGDEYAFCVCRVITYNHTRILYYEYVGGMRDLDFEDASARICYKLKEMGVNDVRLENNQDRERGFRKIMHECKYDARLRTFKLSSNKEMRIKKAIPAYASTGCFGCRPSVIEDRETLSQLQGLRYDSKLPKFDDRLDVIVYAMEELGRFVKPEYPDDGEVLGDLFGW